MKKSLYSFSYSLAFDAPFWGYPSEYCDPVWYTEELEWRGYDGKKFWGYVQRCPQNSGVWQTDRQRDRRTDILSWHSPCYAYASRWKTAPIAIWKLKKKFDHLAVIDFQICCCAPNCIEIGWFLAERYYVAFGLWHEPSVCRPSVVCL